MQHDFHGHNIAESVQIAEDILFKVRENLSEQIWEFITGAGVIQNRLVLWCIENDLEYHIYPNNLGIIKVFIE